MIFNKPDGIIEVESSGCCCPPGQQREGQHTNSGTRWWRVNGGPWNPQPSPRVGLVSTAAVMDTCENFVRSMEAAKELHV